MLMRYIETPSHASIGRRWRFTVVTSEIVRFCFSCSKADRALSSMKTNFRGLPHGMVSYARNEPAEYIALQ